MNCASACRRNGEIIGPRYPLALNRAQRLRAHHAPHLSARARHDADKQSSGGKRDVRKYLESLEGIVPYVTNRVLLLRSMRM